MTRRKYWLAGAALAAAALWFAGGAIWKATRAARIARTQVAASQTVAFTARDLDRALPAMEPVSGATVFSDAAIWNGRIYIAGPSILAEYDGAGTVLRRWRAGLELPAAPLNLLAVGSVAASTGPELWVGTNGAGLLEFDGRMFRQVLPDNPAARKITALLPAETGRIVFGAAGAGVLTYDGKSIAPFHASLAALHVTALAGDAVDLWAGTTTQGVYHLHAGILERVTEHEGLPDPQVTALAVSPNGAFAATPMGIAAIRNGRVERTLAAGLFASALALDSDTLIAGSLDEGVTAIPVAGRVPRFALTHTAAPEGAVHRLIRYEGGVLALTSTGLYRSAGGHSDWRRLVGPEPGTLTDRNISALAFDATGRLWIGYFDRGLDVLDGGRATHFENDSLFCINRIVYNSADRSTAVATANGLVIFDSRPAQRRVLRRADGLAADNVTDVALRRDGMAVATPAGITFLDAAGTHSVSDFHGLVNRHVYTLASDGDQMLAGTLGGLSIFEREAVRASYTTFNSHLKHNWITALERVGEDWFVGTYGAGVLRLGKDGSWSAFPDLRGSIVINPNALLATPSRIYAGSMEEGLLVYERSTGRWHAATDGLPSVNVTALAAAAGAIYIGTDNGLVRAAERSLP